MPEGRRPPPDWVSVSSSNVEAVRFVGADWLDVRFLAKGKARSRTYRYYGVPWSVYWEMMAAPSKGQFVWQRLRGRYEYAEIS